MCDCILNCVCILVFDICYPSYKNVVVFLFSVPKPVLELATRTDKAKRVDGSDDIRNELSNLWGFSHLQKKLSMNIAVSIEYHKFEYMKWILGTVHYLGHSHVTYVTFKVKNLR